MFILKLQRGEVTLIVKDPKRCRSNCILCDDLRSTLNFRFVARGCILQIKFIVLDLKSIKSKMKSEFKKTFAVIIGKQ